MTGKLCYHKKAKVVSGDCMIEPGLKRGFEFVSFCLGYRDTKEDVAIEDAKLVLNGMGWLMFDDVKEILGPKYSTKLVEAIEEKHRLRDNNDKTKV